jgi:hypothetical protein
MSKDNTTTVVSKEDLQSAVNNNTIKGVLTRVFKLFLKAYGKDKTAVWNALMDRYVNDPSNNIPNDRSKQTSAKGNAKREYLAPQLSWTKFCEAMRFADFEKLEMIFIATNRDGEKMKLTEVIDFGTPIDPDPQNDLVNDHVQQVNQEFTMSDKASDARQIAMSGGLKPVTRGRDWMSSSRVDIGKLIEDNTVKSPIPPEEDIPF